MARPSHAHRLTEATAQFFRTNPNLWLNARKFLPVGGTEAWRSRISDCRTKLGMDVENRQKVVGGIRVSEYRLHDPARPGYPRRTGQNQYTKRKPRTGAAKAKSRVLRQPVLF
jgi:hypothetical protein